MDFLKISLYKMVFFKVKIMHVLKNFEEKNGKVMEKSFMGKYMQNTLHPCIMLHKVQKSLTQFLNL